MGYSYYSLFADTIEDLIKVSNDAGANGDRLVGVIQRRDYGQYLIFEKKESG